MVSGAFFKLYLAVKTALSGVIITDRIEVAPAADP
jgi:hypothetical protein